MAGSSTTTEEETTAAPARPAQALADLVPGTRARVVRVLAPAGAGGAEIARRLQDLGFTPGAVVDVVRRAPLRDPVEFRVKDYDICLRRAQAACIEAVVLDGVDVAATAGVTGVAC